MNGVKGQEGGQKGISGDFVVYCLWFDGNNIFEFIWEVLFYFLKLR